MPALSNAPNTSPKPIFAVPAGDRTLSVLIVDDHLEERAQLRELLEEVYGEDVRLEQCETGLAAVELLRKRRFDLVMIDQLLPDMDGLELVSEVADLVDDTAIIMMSNAASDRVAADAIKTGARDYLCKRDLDAHDLEQAIIAAMRTARVEARNNAMVKQIRETNAEMDRFMRSVAQGMQSNLQQLQHSMGALKQLCGSSGLAVEPTDAGQAGALMNQIARVERDLKQSQELVSNLAQLTRLLQADAHAP